MRQYDPHGHALKRPLQYHLSAHEYMRNPAELNQFLVDHLLEIKHRNQQLIIFPHTQRRSYFDRSHQVHQAPRCAEFS